MKGKKNIILRSILLMVQGCIVGVGAILPGVSGGTLCYAFGIYNPILEVLSHPFKGIKKYWQMLIFVFLGVGIGFVGFAGVTNWLLGLNEGVVLCVFVGLIAGTLPDIWKDAGEKGRNKFSIIALLVSFAAITAVFYVFKNVWTLTIEPNFVGWLLCGLLWGLSFIVPGFSSSTLLLFFGIYEKMSEGISHLDFGVLIPLGIAMLATLLLFSKLMEFIFGRFHSVASHCVLGFVVATTLMILPSFNTSFINVLFYIVCIACGAVASFFFSKACNKIRAISEAKEN
jgi:putative membrane protein